ncbi:MAG TPA: Hsp20/alpha crystallin family protein [Bdellovibrionales bacterium]|nr:Hsp20/alpha crystallin family protein [Bdellovibrionales bacterium]
MKQLNTYNGRSLWDFMSEVERAFDTAWQPEASARRQEMFMPAVDLHETTDSFLISVDLPGVEQKDVKIDVQDGRLVVKGERARQEEKNDGLFRRFERSYGSFERSFQLPQNVSQDKIQAAFENGVLEILVPKAEIAKPRTVQIKTGKGGLFSRLTSAPPASQSAEEKDNH